METRKELIDIIETFGHDNIILADKILNYFIVTRRNALTNCPYCKSDNIEQKTKTNDWCRDCKRYWKV